MDRIEIFFYDSKMVHQTEYILAIRIHLFGSPVGDDEDGFVFNKPGQSLLNGSFVFHIQAGSGLVQQDDGRILQEGAAMEMR